MGPISALLSGILGRSDPAAGRGIIPPPLSRSPRPMVLITRTGGTPCTARISPIGPFRLWRPAATSSTLRSSSISGQRTASKTSSLIRRTVTKRHRSAAHRRSPASRSRPWYRSISRNCSAAMHCSRERRSRGSSSAAIAPSVPPGQALATGRCEAKCETADYVWIVFNHDHQDPPTAHRLRGTS